MANTKLEQGNRNITDGIRTFTTNVNRISHFGEKTDFDLRAQ